MIVAGVTGSIPATVELMRAVARLPHGAIVLPGLDLHLDDGELGGDRRASRASAVRLRASCSPPSASRARDVQQSAAAPRLERGRRGARCAHQRGHAPVRHDRAAGSSYIADGRSRTPMRGALAGVSLIEAPTRAGRGRGRRAHPARGGRDARPHGRARLARPAARPPRRRAARSLGHPRRRLRRPPVRQDGARHLPRSRRRRRRRRLRAGRR